MEFQPSNIQALTFALCVIGTWVWFSWTRNRRPRLPYPPGPKPIPFLGNVFDVPSSEEWLTLTAWGKKHGPLVMVNVFGKKTCIINSAEVASELLASGGRAKKYSERPNFVMVKELMGWDFNLGFMNLSNPTYLEHRQNFVQALSPKNSDAYMPIQTHETILLLQRLLESPARFEEHIKSSIGSVMMRTAFGYQPTENDPLVRIAEEAMHVMVKAGRPGAHLVDVLPILKYVPEWFPGAQFKRVAREGYKLAQELQNDAWSWATDQYEKGTAKESVFTFLMDKVARGADVKRVKEDCALLYATGTDTIASSVLTFVLAMLHAPEVQRRAQEELDRVTGKGRLPTFEDSADLPYITAIAKESLRWESVTPLGLPHALKEDDIYAGYFIPAGLISGPCRTMSPSIRIRCHSNRNVSCTAKRSVSPTRLRLAGEDAYAQGGSSPKIGVHLTCLSESKSDE